MSSDRARLWQLRERRELRGGMREPRVIDRIERAECLDDVAGVQRVVARRDDEVEVLRADARIEDLQRESRAFAPLAQPARQQRRLAAAADRHERPRRLQVVAQACREPETRAGGQTRSEPAPRCARLQANDMRGQAHRVGQRQRLAFVPGGAVADDPDGRVRSD